MAEIRPTPWSPVQTPAPTAGRSAAQRAFFDAAMGRAPSAAVTSSPAQARQPVETRAVRQAAPTPVAAPTQAGNLPTGQAQSEAPKKILRPGSLIDIRV